MIFSDAKSAKRFAVVPVVASLMVLGISANAYVPILTTNDNLVRWSLDESAEDQPNVIEGSVEFFTNRTGTPDIADDGEGGGGEFEILRRAFRSWERVSTSRIDFNDLKLSDQTLLSPVDMTNVIAFDEANDTELFPEEAGIIAITLLTFDDEEFEGRFDGRIRDADLVFNGRDFLYGENGEPDRIDLLAVATHEIGHICGLDHSFHQHSDPSCDCVETPAMFPFLLEGDTSAGTLKVDDVAGITELYPNDEIDRKVNGSISGRVTMEIPDKSAKGIEVAPEPLFGVEVVAYQNGRPVVGTISRTDGIYRIHGVPAGTYILKAQPIFAGYVSHTQDLASDFQAEFYPAAGLTSDASAVSVTAGRRRFNLNFEVASATSPDFFEPNDDAGMATDLAADGPRMLHQFYRDGDEDWVRFDAVSGVTYDLITNNLSFFADPLMELYGPDSSTLIATNDDVDWTVGDFSARIRFTASEEGTHFIRLIDAGSFSGTGTDFEFSIEDLGLIAKLDVNADGKLDALDLLGLVHEWQAPANKPIERERTKVDSSLLIELIEALGRSN